MMANVIHQCRTYMKMMLADHFIHADLHPGNILVRLPREKHDDAQLIILDAGLVTKLSNTDAEHFVELFKAILDGT
jgi:aarF domain-containing kinase